MTDGEVGKFVHDMNNIMMSIVSTADLILTSVPEDHVLRHDVEDILQAGEKGVALIRTVQTKYGPSHSPG